MKKLILIIFAILLISNIKAQIRKIDTVTINTKGLYFKVKPDSSIIIKGDTLKAFRYLLDEIHDMDVRMQDMHDNYALQVIANGYTTADKISTSNCRDTIIKHYEKCIYWTVIDFEKNSFKMDTGYRCHDEKILVGNCYTANLFNPVTYYFLQRDKKTKVKLKVFNCVIL